MKQSQQPFFLKPSSKSQNHCSRFSHPALCYQVLTLMWQMEAPHRDHVYKLPRQNNHLYTDDEGPATQLHVTRPSLPTPLSRGQGAENYPMRAEEFDIFPCCPAPAVMARQMLTLFDFITAQPNQMHGHCFLRCLYFI